MVGNEKDDLTGFLPDPPRPPLRERIKDLPHKIKKIPRRTWEIVDFATDPEIDSVVPSLIVFYVICAFDGWYNLFVVEVPTQVLEKSLNEWQYSLFLWMTLVSPAMTLAGIYIRGRFAWTGATLRLAGDIGVAGILWTFLTAIAYTQWWGQGNFAGAWVFASAVGAIVFCIRDVRRLIDKDRWVVL